MKIPAQRIGFSQPDIDFVQSGVHEILSSGVLTMGRYTQQFEEAFARFTGCEFAVSCSSGTAALELILRALGIEGKSVVVPTNTFLATALAVIHSGNRVIFADSDPATFCLDLADLESRLEPDTAAVVLVHVGGVITPAVRELVEFCRLKSLHLIEDCAHAHGCAFDGQNAGTFGIAGAFSFFPTKVLTTGEGGMVTTSNRTLARTVSAIRNHGKNPELGNRMSELGANYRLNELAALVGVQQLSEAETKIRARRKVAAFYDDRLDHDSIFRPFRLTPQLFSTYYKYILTLDYPVPHQLEQAMKEKYGIFLPSRVYAELCHTEPVWERFGYCGRERSGRAAGCSGWPDCKCSSGQRGFPGAERISQNHVCLPIYPDLEDAELEYVVSSVREALTSLTEARSCAS